MPASSRRARGRSRHRSRTCDDSADRFSGVGACPRRRSSGSLRLDIQPKPWHKRQDGLGVSEPEAVTRVRRISPGPHPQLAQPTRSPSHNTSERGRGRCRVCGRTERAHSRLENRTEHGFPQPPTPSTFLDKRKEKSKTRTTGRPLSRFTRFQMTVDRPSETSARSRCSREIGRAHV